MLVGDCVFFVGGAPCLLVGGCVLGAGSGGVAGVDLAGGVEVADLDGAFFW